MKDILLSIVIPTRNRDLYCIEAIKNILGYSDDCFELIIQDNSDSDEIQNYVGKNVDKRLQYYKISGRLNSVLNMDSAIAHARGEYIIMIGDDDTILPNLFSVVKWAKTENIDAITPSNNPAFFWGDDGSKSGHLILQPVKKSTHWSEPRPRLVRLLKNGLIDYQRYLLPRVYHGLIRRKVLNAIKEKTGHFIGGLSPDIYLTVSSCFYISKYVILDFPISIQGACVQSTSVGNPRGKFEEMPHLWNRGEYYWDELIPKYNSSQTIWAETALKAITDNGKDLEYRPLFDKKYFMTAFWLENNDRKKEISALLGETKYVNISCFLKYYYSYIGLVFNALKRRLRGRKEYQICGSWDSVLKYLESGIIYKS